MEECLVVLPVIQSLKLDDVPTLLSHHLTEVRDLGIDGDVVGVETQGYLHHYHYSTFSCILYCLSKSLSLGSKSYLFILTLSPLLYSPPSRLTIPPRHFFIPPPPSSSFHVQQLRAFTSSRVAFANSVRTKSQTRKSSRRT